MTAPPSGLPSSFSSVSDPSGATFKTLACTGATTLHIYDPADPNPTPPPGTAHATDRPSPHAPLGRAIYRREPPNQRVQVHKRDPLWEPRQAVSLKHAQTKLQQSMQNVDLVTLTIGGNDAGFSDVLASCVEPILLELDLTCDESNLASGFERVGERVADAVTRLRKAAPAASILVLGYPYVTPSVGGCKDPEVRTLAGATVLVHESDECEARFEYIESCSSLSGRPVVNRSGAIVGALLQAATDFLSGNPTRVGRINFGEARFLWRTADLLNDRLREAARRSGAHFIDVVGAVATPSAPTGFVGHSPCAGRDAWLHGFVARSGLHSESAAAGQSFHPNLEGQRGYAAILEQYIRDAAAVEGAALNEAGLPVNPAPDRPTGHGARGSAVAGAAARGSGSRPGQAGDLSSDADGDRGQLAGDTAEATAGYLVAQRVVALSGCGSPFVSPGEKVRLVAGGFAAGASVSFAAQAVSLGGTALTAPTLAAVAADADGAVSAAWSVPSAPAVSADAAPRAYVVNASGAGPGGGTRTAYMIEPLVAYPATAPCATADAATTTLGRSVSVAVVSNDTAPSGGTLDAPSVQILDSHGGSFSANAVTGAVTFTPDAGFYGTAEGTYAVYDKWGIGVRGDITVTVASGCTITGTSGVTTIAGTDGDDVICVPDPDDRRAFHVIDAKRGDDTIIGGAGVEWVYGGAGADTIYGRGGDDRIIAGAGADTVYGGAGRDHIYSADLADTVIDDDYEMVVAPSVTVPQAGPAAGDDWQYADVAQTVTIDVLDNDHDPNEDLDPASLRIVREPVAGSATVARAGDGRAVIEYAAAGTGGIDSLAYEICDALNGCDTAEVTVMAGGTGCTIVGTEAAETLYGTAGDDVICGLGGDDIIYGMGGDDIIVGGDGADSLYGGDQTLSGAADGDDLLWGGSGDDALYGGEGSDALWGGDGNDTLQGNGHDDRIHGGAGNDTAAGGGGSDRIWGGPGNDVLDGDTGVDTVFGGPGADVLRGGNGDDALWGGPGNDVLDGGDGADALYGGAGADTLAGRTLRDVLWGGPGDDTLDGGSHSDQLHGGPGDDTLRGGTSDDRVYGGSGDDTLDGSDGTDHLDGGPGADTCARGETTAGCERGIRL